MKNIAVAESKVQGPVPGTVMTEGFARAVAAMAYAWGWPLVNIHNRRLLYSKIPQMGLLGPTPVAPVNQLAMAFDYLDPHIKIVAHPNQDVVYGFGALGLDKEPVILQVPDFGSRFWLYELADQRTDCFAQVGRIYDTRPGFYLIAGPDWQGTKPQGVTDIFRSPTSTGVVIPRVFMADTVEDRSAIQPFLRQIVMYPLSNFTGKTQTVDWKTLAKLPVPEAGGTSGGGSGETQWVKPENFFLQLGQILDEVPPLPGEEAMYGQFRALLVAAEGDSAIANILQDTAVESEKEIVGPLFFLSNNGVRIANHWTRPFNNAAFGTDYLTRLAVAKSNIFENSINETVYIFQYKDENGDRLDCANCSYTLTFPPGGTPEVSGFWSLTMYDKQHFFVPNEIERYSIGTKNKEMRLGPDNSLTIYIQSARPSDDKVANWLPAPAGEFAMTIRAYGPSKAVINGEWSPPPVRAGAKHRDVHHQRP